MSFGSNLKRLNSIALVDVPLIKLNPNPKIRFKNCPEMLPVHAITAKPIEAREPLAKKSAREFPNASSVALKRVSFQSFVMEKN
jgi:hypothetical protein